jgi:NTE family protein
VPTLITGNIQRTQRYLNKKIPKRLMEYFEPGKLSRKKTALVLGGGGAKGAFEIGVLKVLLPYISPHVIIGTSVGAAIGAMAALGMDPQAMEKVWLPLKRKDIFPYNPQLFYSFIYTDSIFSNTKWEKLVTSTVHDKRFEDCLIPLYVNTTRLSDGKNIFFDSGQLAPAVMASSATPLFFPPYAINGVKYIDGFVGTYLGIDKVRSLNCKQVIIINLGIPNHYEQSSRNLFYNASYALDLLTYQSVKSTLEKVKDLHVVLIEMRRFNHLSNADFSMTKELIAEGEKEAKFVLNKISL